VRRGIVGEQALTERQESGTAAIGEEAERADADKAAGQHVEQEATQELLRTERHHFLLIAVGIIFPTESNLILFESHEAMVGDGHAMGVTGEIAEHMMGTAEGWLGIDDPVLTEQGAQERAERLLVGKGLKSSGEGELVLLESSFQAGDELAAEDATEYVDGEEEGIAGMNPLSAVGREATGGNDAVDVRMSEQVLSPGMEYREESDLGAQMFGIAGYFQKGFRTGAEQEVIEDLLVLQRQWGELVRQSKDNVDIGDGQKFTLPSHNPLVASAALTLWAMAIAATVIRGGAIATARALIAMPAE